MCDIVWKIAEDSTQLLSKEGGRKGGSVRSKAEGGREEVCEAEGKEGGRKRGREGEKEGVREGRRKILGEEARMSYSTINHMENLRITG